MTSETNTSPKTLWESTGGMPLPNDWQVVKVDELLADDRGISVGVMYPGEHEPNGVPLIKAGDIQNSVLSTQIDSRISRAVHQEYKRTALEGGELLITLVGTPGQCVIIPKKMAGWNAARALAVVRLKDPNDAQFFRYAFQNPITQHLVREWCNTTVQATLNLREIKELPLPWPPAPKRRHIAHILGTLDDKIELNRQMNRTLEAMARALFKSWFIDFDPVRAKMEGRQPTGLAPETAALFPDRLVDSELGLIPEGWEVKPLGDVFNVEWGCSPPGDSYNDNGEGLPFFQGSREFRERFPEHDRYCTEPKRIAEPGDTLMSIRAPVGAINMADRKCIIGRGLTGLLHNSKNKAFTFYAIHGLSKRLATYAADGTVFKSITKRNFTQIPILNPPSALIGKYETYTSPLDKKILTLSNQSKHIQAIRDAISPTLLHSQPIHKTAP